ncbi:MazG-like family protein [Actinoallomurus iriomotensis]|uniref:NTP pyrophosphohydrolase MazG putative catalytic core domain-containing protein n=1 Tax=Actinoallomurus iriomotensis TaxID=478107 RepID=A0A9W6RUP7_9ACTN|nr:MazG-like family protein [Actinoallomurus iriomotensis]GLY82053.1 hypothetical protein Airi01_103200 [Actinoallomurus iriomotensis]
MELYECIRIINAWIENANGGTLAAQHDDAMRIMKISEELGEVTQAYIGFTGQNPRKGKTHTKDDVLKELADVTVTALCAIQHFTQDPTETEKVITDKIRHIMARSPEMLETH